MLSQAEHTSLKSSILKEAYTLVFGKVRSLEKKRKERKERKETRKGYEKQYAHLFSFWLVSRRLTIATIA